MTTTAIPETQWAEMLEMANEKFDEYNLEYNYPHSSHAAAYALEEVAAKYGIGYGVEGDCEGNGGIDIMYINMGDTYDKTIVFFEESFLIGSWGDCVESL